MIGLDAPKTLKEKLAEKEQSSQVRGGAVLGPQRLSQKSLPEGSEKQQQLGENTIEMAAVQAIVEEAEAQAQNEAQQQGTQSKCWATLADRWLKQVKYENIMECARKMWDQFTSGTQIKHQRRKRAQAEEQHKQQLD